MTFSIVIPAWNESDSIEATLEAAKTAVAGQAIDGDIIVVDNNSTDNTAELAIKAGARVVFEPINQIARARNAGASASEAKWLVFLDADTTLTAELLAAALKELSSGDVIGGGSTVALDREVSVLPNLTLRFWNWWSVKSSTAAGCFIYCTKEAFEAVGGFDEKYYAAEELHLSKRMRKLAIKLNQRFVILTIAPIVSSARKVDWYSPWQFFKQVILLLLPGTTRSRVMCYLWYDRSTVRKGDDTGGD